MVASLCKLKFTLLFERKPVKAFVFQQIAERLNSGFKALEEHFLPVRNIWELVFLLPANQQREGTVEFCYSIVELN